MIKKSNFIIIGSTGRNTGKTEFACRLIEKYSKTHQICGVKVVAIDRREGNCPKGGKGCGVCTSLDCDYEIFEETVNDPNKDTSRMLIAGAKKVYFLKVEKNSLEKGLEALLKIIPKNYLVVVESNSIRKVLEPGLFIVIKNLQDKTIKDSCAEVVDFADKIIVFDNMNWDFSPDRVLIKDCSWIIKQKATAIILAGGKSSRMRGEDKSLLPINGKPMIKYIFDQIYDIFDEVIIGANDFEKYKFLNCKIVPDLEPENGPLMGILSCLKESKNDLNFITACDIPEMNLKLIQNMLNLATDYDAVVPVKDMDNQEPLYAVYKKTLISNAELVIKSGKRRIIEIFKNMNVKYIDFDYQGWYQNLNMKDDYLKFVTKKDNQKCFRFESDT